MRRRWSATDLVTDASWDQFLSRVHAPHHAQTSTWARAKSVNGWRVARVLVASDGEPVAGAQVLHRSMKGLGGLGFSSAGPVFVSERPPEVEHHTLEALRRLSRRRRIHVVVVQPQGDDPRLHRQLVQSDFAPTSVRVAPRSTVVIDLAPDEETLFTNMRKKHRQGVRRAQREGLTVRLATDESIEADLAAFSNLLRAAGDRVGYRPFTDAYYRHLWQTFSRASDPSTQCALIMVEHDAAPITALNLIGHGEGAATKTIGWSGALANLKPNQLAYWAGIQWAKQAGYRWLDFEGIDDDAADLVLAGKPLTPALRSSPSFLKLGMGGEVRRAPEAYAYSGHRVVRFALSRVLPAIESSSTLHQALDRLRTA